MVEIRNSNTNMKEKELIELKLRRCGSSTLFEMVMINELIKVNTKE